jgi:hypothetical protein
MNFIGKKQKIAIFADDYTINGRTKWFLGETEYIVVFIDLLRSFKFLSSYAGIDQ